jgi:hypothetical protein
MCVGSPTAGTWSSSQWRPDNEFETDRRLAIAIRPARTEARSHQRDLLADIPFSRGSQGRSTGPAVLVVSDASVRSLALHGCEAALVLY